MVYLINFQGVWVNDVLLNWIFTQFEKEITPLPVQKEDRYQ